MRFRAAPVGLVLVLAVPAQQRAPDLHEQTVLWIHDLADPERRDHATDRLAELGALATPVLVDFLSSERAPRRPDPADIHALRALERIGPEATYALPKLLTWARGRVHRRLRGPLLDAIGSIGPFRREAVPAVFDVLEAFRENNGPCCSREFIRTYCRLQFDPDQPLHELTRGLEDDNPFVREFCAELIGRLGPSARSATRALSAALAAEHEGEVALRGSNWSAAVLGRFDTRVHRQLAEALIRVAPQSIDAIPAWALLLNHGSRPARREAAMVLAQFGPDASDAVPALTRALGDPDIRVVREAVTALGSIGAASAPAKDLLVELANDDDRQVAMRARAALRNLRDG